MTKEPQDRRAKWCCFDCDGKRSVRKDYQRSRPKWRVFLKTVAKRG